MTAYDFRSVYNRVVPIVENKYGIEVTISDVVDPNTGDFDGRQILIDYDQDLEVALDVRGLLKRGGEALTPQTIPRFTPRKFASRWSF